ncbi:hypothetical protein F5Y06DRAFT_300324 [Hypoxylon sp. FL0890]|nr:hypothetical protein F5Y06DRAFT_300324 [Hypoxylon sp. FL0890]
MDVTPPRPIKPCNFAVRTGSKQRPNYCSEAARQRTKRNVWEDAVWRERPCIPCEQRQLKQVLDENWHSILRRNFHKLTEPEISFYQECRREIFEDNYYWDWSELHANLIDDLRQDIRAKYDSGRYEDGEAPGPSSEREKGHRSTRYHHRRRR